MEGYGEIELPAQLEHYRKQLGLSVLPSIIITPQQKSTALFDSKFSGYPYLPKNKNYPKDVNRQPMHLLAQINFTQFPHCPPFPTEGLLQFFISDTFDNQKAQIHDTFFQHFFKVRYFPTILGIDQLVTDFINLTKEKPINFPFSGEMFLTFSNKMEPVSAMDFRLKQFLNVLKLEQHFLSEDGRTIEEIYLEKYLGADHKIGGYPYFIHQDTRASSNLLRKFDTLLLQIISNNEQGIMWGDCGVLKFSINGEKLRQLDFSEIYLHAEQY